MDNIIQKLNNVRSLIDNENSQRGSISLLVLILRTDLEEKWDIVLSADYFETSNSQQDLVSFINKLKIEFDSNLDFLANIFLSNSQDPFILKLAKGIKESNGGTEGEINNLTFPNFSILKLNVVFFNFSQDILNTPDTNIESSPLIIGTISEFE